MSFHTPIKSKLQIVIESLYYRLKPRGKTTARLASSRNTDIPADTHSLFTITRSSLNLVRPSSHHPESGETSRTKEEIQFSYLLSKNSLPPAPKQICKKLVMRTVLNWRWQIARRLLARRGGRVYSSSIFASIGERTRDCAVRRWTREIASVAVTLYEKDDNDASAWGPL